MTGAALAGGYVADLIFGDPVRHHPVAGFGQLATRTETLLYAPTRARGLTYAAGLAGAATLTGGLLARAAGRVRGGRAVVLAVVTWAALGGRSLTGVADGLADAVQAGDLDGARRTLACLCGRDAHALDGPGLSRAAVESVAENTADAVVGVLLWGALAGPAGVMGYRAANTLDAMVGHRDDRYGDFGWAAARLDDALNWPVARLSAVITVVCAPVVGGSPATTWRVLRRDGAHHPSPNAGRVEAAFAGALGLALGGPLTYAGVLQTRPTLGNGTAPTPADVHRSTRLSLAVGTLATVTCAGTRALLGRRRGGTR